VLEIIDLGILTYEVNFDVFLPFNHNIFIYLYRTTYFKRKFIELGLDKNEE